MHDSLKQALDQERAEGELKQKTKEYVFQKTQGCKRAKQEGLRIFLPAAAGELFIYLGGY